MGNWILFLEETCTFKKKNRVLKNLCLVDIEFQFCKMRKF